MDYNYQILKNVLLDVFSRIYLYVHRIDYLFQGIDVYFTTDVIGSIL